MNETTSWTAGSPGSVLEVHYLQIDAGDDALAAVRRLKDDRDAHRRLHENMAEKDQAARKQLVEVHAYLEELGIPTHCASGSPLTFAQRVAIAIATEPTAPHARSSFPAAAAGEKV